MSPKRRINKVSDSAMTLGSSTYPISPSECHQPVGVIVACLLDAYNASVDGKSDEAKYWCWSADLKSQGRWVWWLSLTHWHVTHREWRRDAKVEHDQGRSSMKTAPSWMWSLRYIHRHALVWWYHCCYDILSYGNDHYNSDSELPKISSRICRGPFNFLLLRKTRALAWRWRAPEASLVTIECGSLKYPLVTSLLIHPVGISHSDANSICVWVIAVGKKIASPRVHFTAIQALNFRR